MDTLLLWERLLELSHVTVRLGVASYQYGKLKKFWEDILLRLL